LAREHDITTPKLNVLSVSELTQAAGGDPWQLQDQLLAGKPYQINTMALAFHKSGSHSQAANSAFELARKHFQDAYASGTRANVINDSLVVRDATARLHSSATKIGQIGTYLEQIAAGLSDAQDMTHPPIDALNTELTKLDLECQYPPVSAPPNPALHLYESTTQAVIEQATKTATAAVKATYSHMKKIVAGYENLLNARMTEISRTGYTAPVQLDDAAPNTNPKTVNGWWTKLTPTEQQILIDENPTVIGNLNGIPVATRSKANEIVMNADINRVQKILDGKNSCVPLATIEADPAKYGLTAADLTRYQNALVTRSSLEMAGTPTSLIPGSNPKHLYPTYLFAYQPLALGGKGAYAIAIGDPDKADNTAVVVPGEVWGGSAARNGNEPTNILAAQAVYTESNKANPNHPTAVIAWEGYDNTGGLKQVLEANTSAVRAGGAALAQDVNGLAATHQVSENHLTVIGYSGGAAVVSDAAAASHMHANDVVLVGTVTTDQAHSAAAYHLQGGHVYYGVASDDPVAAAGHEYLKALSTVTNVHESVPSDPGFGAIRIAAQNPSDSNLLPSSLEHVLTVFGVPGASLGNYSATGHNDYFDPGSESLYAMTDITSGLANDLGEDHMLGEGATPQSSEDYYH
jgi:predicted esterase